MSSKSKWERALAGMRRRVEEDARRKAYIKKHRISESTVDMKEGTMKSSEIRGTTIDKIWIDEFIDLPKSPDWSLPEGKIFGEVYETLRVDKMYVTESTPELVQEEKAKLAEARARLVGQIQNWVENTNREIDRDIEEEKNRAFYEANPDFGIY